MLQDFMLVPSKEHFSSILDGILETFASNYIHHKTLLIVLNLSQIIFYYLSNSFHLLIKFTVKIHKITFRVHLSKLNQEND